MQIHRRYAFVVVVAGLLAWFAETERLRASSADELTAGISHVCEAGRFPQTVQIDRAVLPHISVMLRRSRTFREQCRRVADTRHLYIRVHVNGLLDGDRFRAVTRISRFESGVIIAEVELRTPWAPEEWIAHELEHVLEQIDRVPLAELADRTGRVWRTANNMFESERAIRAGRTVLQELRHEQRSKVPRLRSGQAPRLRSGQADGFVE